ncbi:MAG: hypothetical protein GY714_04555 [Desulfobacterales bacterium]|nr:hypothetical protein [Desulfobacterales bacterium]MCP4163999.1 hypothetical protein [Deltaproteobacteria bacterium]
MKIKTIVTVFLILSLYTAQLFAGDITIIANKSVDVSKLSKKDVKKIFLGKKRKWDAGDKIIFVTLQKKSDSHKKFLKTYVKKNPSQFANFWKKLVFTGKGKMPKYFKSEEAMVKFVAKTKNAIGYVSSNIDLGNTKKISIN